MTFVLDTNVASEALKPTPDPRCEEWVKGNLARCCLTTITLSELRYGIERLPDGRRKRELDRKLDFLWQDFGERILEFDAVAAVEFGRYVADFELARGLDAVQKGDVRDFQMGAMARAHGWAVASRNVRHFPCVQCVNPFEGV